MDSYIDPTEEDFKAFVARYPGAAAFLEMIGDSVCKQAVRHRQVAVETSRLLRCSDF
ncbi:hypothetical protein [Emcibacter nanhaiensis]